MPRYVTAFLLALASAGAVYAAPAANAGEPVYSLEIANHRFQPAEVQVPAGVKVKLIVKNRDATPEEFESYELGREKVIPGGATAVVYIGPLEPGTYPFIGEFHQDTAKGRVVAK